MFKLLLVFVSALSWAQGESRCTRLLEGPEAAQTIGCVAIGRNEGQRLILCLESLAGRVGQIVYVDSGSTDGSVEAAKQRGADVVALDTSIPFTAARARNAGAERLKEVAPDTQYVQFVDGDCEVVPGWLEKAHARMEQRPELAAVCGRRRERHPEHSVWNRLVDIEWNTPVGDALACGGDALMRMSAFNQVGGYDPSLIAGEEPELCLRMRSQGWKIERIDAEMTLHDAAMTRAQQWWKRTVRSGHAYAEGAYLHGASPERHWVKETRRIVFWGAVVPTLAAGFAIPTGGASLALLGGYPISAYRAYFFARARGHSPEDSAAYAIATTAGKFAEMQGVIQFYEKKLKGQRSTLIEYK